MAKSEYHLPSSVLPYKHLIANTGGNDVEALIDRYLNEANLLATNLPVYLLGLSVYAQVGMIEAMIKEGILA